MRSLTLTLVAGLALALTARDARAWGAAVAVGIPAAVVDDPGCDPAVGFASVQTLRTFAAPAAMPCAFPVALPFGVGVSHGGYGGGFHHVGIGGYGGNFGAGFGGFRTGFPVASPFVNVNVGGRGFRGDFFGGRRAVARNRTVIRR